MNLRISDHAVLRYIERYHKLDLNKIRHMTNTQGLNDYLFLEYLEDHCKLNVNGIKKEILPDSIRSSVNAGATSFTVNGIKFRINNNVVVTGIVKNSNRTTKGRAHFSNRKTKRHFKGVRGQGKMC